MRYAQAFPSVGAGKSDTLVSSFSIASNDQVNFAVPGTGPDTGGKRSGRLGVSGHLILLVLLGGCAHQEKTKDVGGYSFGNYRFTNAGIIQSYALARASSGSCDTMLDIEDDSEKYETSAPIKAFNSNANLLFEARQDAMVDALMICQRDDDKSVMIFKEDTKAKMYLGLGGYVIEFACCHDDTAQGFRIYTHKTSIQQSISDGFVRLKGICSEDKYRFAQFCDVIYGRKLSKEEN